MAILALWDRSELGQMPSGVLQNKSVSAHQTYSIPAIDESRILSRPSRLFVALIRVSDEPVTAEARGLLTGFASTNSMLWTPTV
jgi:hypothetical protein